MTFEQVIEALRNLNPKCKNFVELFEKAKPNDKLLVAKNFDVQDREEEKLVQQLVDYLEVPQIAGSEMSKVRDEMTKLSMEGKEITTPEEEEMWNKKLADAQKIDIARSDEIKAQRRAELEGKAPLATPPVTSNDPNPNAIPPPPPITTSEVSVIPPAVPVSVNNDLTGVKGLRDKSIKKLMEANIRTVTEFNALSREQKISILGPLVVKNMER